MPKSFTFAVITALLLVSVGSPAIAESPSPHNFSTLLSEAEVVPPVSTHSGGQALFQQRKDGSGLAFRIRLADMKNVGAVHLHLAPSGSNGPIVASLSRFRPEDDATINGVIVRGRVTAADLLAPMFSLNDLVAAMAAGTIYVNVQTADIRSGEVRGQIVPVGGLAIVTDEQDPAAALPRASSFRVPDGDGRI